MPSARSRATRAISPPRESSPRIGLSRSGIAVEAFEALDRGETPAALDALLEQMAGTDEDTREQLRRAIVGILTDLDPGDPVAASHRRRLATALY